MRSVPPAKLALVLSLLVGCRADSAGVESAPPRGDTPALQPATEPAPPSPVTLTAIVAPVVEPPAPVSAKTTAEDPPVGCIERVEDLPASALVDRDDPRLKRDALVVVAKGARRLMLYEHGRSVACYRVALGFAPAGHKLVQGDGRTPEGWYRTSDKPWSSYAHAIAIHYPNADDARAAAEDGRIVRRTRDAIVSATSAGKVPSQSTALGGAVLIHGGGSSADWTLGCIALEDAELVGLRDQLPKGMRTDLLILP